MLRNILVTLDGSAYSEAVLPTAADLATATRSTITLFTVGQPPVATPQSPLAVESQPIPATAAIRLPLAARVRYGETRTQAIERRERELEEYLEEKATALRERGIEVQVAVTMSEDASETIIEYARREAVDLIAMATHGHTGLRGLIFGSVAGRVVGSGVRPVLLVRPGALGRHID